MKSIIMNDFSVQRILSGAKTQTRRVVKPRIKNAFNCYPGASFWVGKHPGGGWWAVDDPDGPPSWMIEDQDLQKREGFLCPYGKPSNHLRVRETWRVDAWDENFGYIAVEYKAGGPISRKYLVCEDEDLFERLWIQSSDDAAAAGIEPDADGQYNWAMGEAPTRWRPSIFMPRWASRITLKITDIRVERVQEISGEDCVNEGATTLTDLNMMLSKKDKTPFHEQNNRKARAIFQALWDSINSKKGYSWNDNPWVWCISFKVVDKL